MSNKPTASSSSKTKTTLPCPPPAVTNGSVEHAGAGKGDSTKITRRDSHTGFTIFAIPKPFTGAAEQIQRNAIGSWKRLVPQAEILLLGDEPGIAELAAEWNLKHVPDLSRNDSGTPRLDSAFELAQTHAKHAVMMYSNCDVIFSANLSDTITQLDRIAPAEFVAFGRRTELKVEHLIDFENRAVVEEFEQRVASKGVWESLVCKEYFIFRRGNFAQLPPFAVGRGNWDNWMITSAKDRNIPVIDLSNLVTAVHQSHDYAHVGRSRWKCYVSGEEAKQNQQLAGGRTLIRGSTATWKLDARGLHRIPLSGLNLAFWKDLPRFSRFLKKLVLG